ncbi:MAG: D-alanyl-lipoteichoic acid biosynthesis protein DltD [Pseudanabaena sp. ELA645]
MNAFDLETETPSALSEELAGLKLSHTKQKGDCLYLYSQDPQVSCAKEILEAIALSTQDLENSILFIEGIRRLKLHGDAWALGVELPIAQSAIACAEIIASLLTSFREDFKLSQTKLQLKLQLKLLLQNNCLNLLCETNNPILQAEIALPMLETLRTLRSSEYFQSVTVSHRLIGSKKPSWSFEIDLLAIGIESVTPEILPLQDDNNSDEMFREENDLELNPSQSGGKNPIGEMFEAIGDRLISIGKICFQFQWLGQSAPNSSNFSDVTSISFQPLSLPSCLIGLTLGLGTTVVIDRILHEYAQTILPPKVRVAEVQENPQVSLENPANKKEISRKTALNFNIARFNEKLALLDWKTTTRKRSPDIIIVGSSRALRGVEPSAFEKELLNKGFKDLNVFNLGLDGATAKVVNLQITQILPRPQLPRMIIWADGLRAFNSSRTDITYDEITASSGYKQLQQTLKEQGINPDPLVTNKESTKNLSSPIAQAFTTIFATTNNRQDVRNSLVKSFDRNTHLLSNSEAIIAATTPATAATLDKQGFVAFDVVFDPKTYFQKYPQVPGDYDLDYRNFDTNGSQFDAFANVVDFCRRNNIQLVVVNMPLHTTYLDPIRTQYEATFNGRMQELSSREGFTYLDLSQTIPYKSELFSDPSHLNKQGAIAIAQMLAQSSKIPWQSLKF